jgi:hypothetical protein
MTVYDLPHATVEEMSGSKPYYKITMDEGWYMHRSEYGENEYGGKIYKTVGTFASDYDFSQLEIVSKADLPENAEIC